MSRVTGRLRGLLGRSSPVDGAPAARVAELEARVNHLEAEIEGLQDALHRVALRHDSEIAELAKDTQPAELARALSEDARKRGL